MQVKFHALPIAFLMLLLISSANAGWSALNSGYAVTTDYHGIDVPLGTLVTATAGTTDSNILNVTFVWKFPNETVAFEDIDVAVWSNGTKYPDENGSLVFYAQSSFRLTVEGEWGVQAYFKGLGGHLRGNGTDIIAIKATSNEIVIPEFSFEGTSGTILAMSLIFALIHVKRKRQNRLRT
jgi:hypothetical protein